MYYKNYAVIHLRRRLSPFERIRYDRLHGFCLSTFTTARTGSAQGKAWLNAARAAAIEAAVKAFGGVEGIQASIPMKRYGANEEIANLAAFLASSGASYGTGAVFIADGGLTVG